MDAKRTLEQFFATYAERFNNSLGDNPVVDVEATANAFADCFIEASPLGVNCGKNDTQFRMAIPQGYAFYRSIGTKSMKITSLTTTPLDDLHWMVKVNWQAEYVKKDSKKELIDFTVIYLVQMVHKKPEIFAYITGDEQKVLRERGLI